MCLRDKIMVGHKIYKCWMLRWVWDVYMAQEMHACYTYQRIIMRVLYEYILVTPPVVGHVHSKTTYP